MALSTLCDATPGTLKYTCSGLVAGGGVAAALVHVHTAPSLVILLYARTCAPGWRFSKFPARRVRRVHYKMKVHQLGDLAHYTISSSTEGLFSRLPP